MGARIRAGGVSDVEQRLREAEALNLLTNRIVMDFLSLQIEAGNVSLAGVKQMIRFSATEVLKGSAGYEQEIRFFENVLVDRFDETFAGRDH